MDEWNVECVNGSLEMWRGMIDLIVDEMICDWCGKIEVVCFKVCVIFLNGGVFVDKKSFFEYLKCFCSVIKEMIKSFVRESVIRFVGVKVDIFSKVEIGSYRFD